MAQSQRARHAVGVHLAAVLERHGPEDQGHQDQQQRQVQRGEQGGVPEREGGEGGAAGGQQPDLVAVPDRADRVEQHAALGVVPRRSSFMSIPTPRSKPSRKR